SVSYYLKGGLVFTVLHSLLLEKGKSVDDLLQLLWSDFKNRPETGVTSENVYDMVKKLAGTQVMDEFSTLVETTQDIDFDKAFKSMGLELKWTSNPGPWLGVEWEFVGDRAVAKSITLDSPAYKGGLNAGDEIVFINGLRFLKEDSER